MAEGGGGGGGRVSAGTIKQPNGLMAQVAQRKGTDVRQPTLARG